MLPELYPSFTDFFLVMACFTQLVLILIDMAIHLPFIKILTGVSRGRGGRGRCAIQGAGGEAALKAALGGPPFLFAEMYNSWKQTQLGWYYQHKVQFNWW